MTTIAIDHKTIAADSRISCDFVDQTAAKKLFRCTTFDGRKAIVGIAGTRAIGLKFVHWIKTGDPVHELSTREAGEVSAIVYYVDTGELHYYDTVLYPQKRDVPFAIGTGASYAMGAMLAGAGASKAVMIACQLDTESGLPVKSMRLSC